MNISFYEMFCEEGAKYGKAKCFDASLIEAVIRPERSMSENAMWVYRISFGFNYFVKAFFL